jgi:hypothetical protein
MQRIRRLPEAVIKSLEMDPDRKYLFVEGLEDRLFIEHVFEGSYDESLIVLEIDSVDIRGNIEGGNRGRVISFAKIADENNASHRIRCFIDKDYSEFIEEVFPTCIITTDFRDLEAYLLEEKYLNKFLKIGLKVEKIVGKHLLDVLLQARYFGCVRVTSLENSLKLSVNSTNEKLHKYVEVTKQFEIEIKEREYIQSLLSNSNIAIKKERLLELLNNTISKYSTANSRDLIHGKDLIIVLKEIISKLGFKKDNIENIFWMSFDKVDMDKYAKLVEVYNFIK